MKRAILPAFIAVAVVATAAILYSVTRGALGRGSPTTAVPAAVAAVTGTPVNFPDGPSAEELRAAGLSPVKPGTRSVDFELEDLKGKKVRLSALQGRVVFLNFWATWCPPCRAEMPSMERLHARLKDKGVVVLGVDLQEGKREVEDFVREHKISFPVVLDRNGSAGAAYGVRSIPTTFIVGQDGAILAGRIGGHEWDDPVVVALLEKLVAR